MYNHAMRINGQPTGKVGTNTTKFDNAFLLIWLVFIATFPFVMDYLHLAPPGTQQSAIGHAYNLSIYKYNPSENIWIFPKVYFLVFTSLILFLYVLTYKQFKNTFVYLLAAYAALALLSSIMSGDSLQYVLLGGEGRGDGLLYTAGLLLLAIFSYTVYIVHGKKALIYFYYALSFSAILEALVAILEHAGFDPIKFSSFSGLPIGTIGNSGMLASLLMVAVFAAIALVAQKERGIGMWYSLLALVVISSGLGCAANRSSIGGLLIGLFALNIADMLFNKSKRFVFGSAVAVIALLLAPYVLPNNTGVSKTYTNPTTLKTRLLIWQISIEAIRKTPGQPFIGAGPDGLKLSIIKRDLLNLLLKEYKLEYGWKEDPELDTSINIDRTGMPLKSYALPIKFPRSKSVRFMQVTLDKAHNLFLGRAVNYGLVSAFIWLLLYLVPMRTFFSFGKAHDALLLSGSSALLALFVYYLFWFPAPQVEPIHVSLLSLLWGAKDSLISTKAKG